jgi:hypothetical protein
MVAAPHPPSLKLPEPVTDLTAKRIGNDVELRWTMPKRATDKVLLAGDQKVRVCRAVDTAPCTIADTLVVASGVPADCIDHLPPALASGAVLWLVYTVELENRSGRSAGPSNAVVTASGPAPPPVEDLRARAQADGIMLSWTPETGDVTVRIYRKLVQEPRTPKSELPLEQTLEFTGKDEGRVLDPDAELDHIYTYTAERVEHLTLKGKPIEVAGEPSKPVTINARDVFPPAVPSGLEAVADAEAHAIDLSWQPDTEADLAGYMVYRREAGSNAQPARISATAQSAPSFRDMTVVPGHTYEYSVSAADRDGNESARSAEIEEALPQP